MMWLCIMCSNILHTMQVRPSPFFRLASNAFPDIGSVDRIEKKNIKKKKNHKKSRNGRPGTPASYLWSQHTRRPRGRSRRQGEV